jgi:hypothetical protein
LTVQATEPKEIETKEVTCIYGKEIRDKCTVRTELAKNNSPEINKYIKPKNGTVFDEAEEIFENMINVNNTLISFCEMCPFLAIYMGKHLNPP